MFPRSTDPSTRACCAVAVLLLAASAAEAAKLKVGRGKTYATIGEAVAKASEGDTILLFRGRYTETVEVSTPRLTFKGKKGAKWLPEVWRGRCLTLTAEATGTTISGVTFSTTGDALTIDAADVTITKCRFRGGHGVTDSGSSGFAHGLTVTRCDFRWGSEAIELDGDGITIERSRMSHYSSGPVDIDGDDLTITRCVLNGSSDDDGFDLRGDRVTVERCRIRSVWNAAIIIRGDDAEVRRNHIDGLISNPGIDVRGDRAMVEDNVVSGGNRDPGIEVYGEAFTVRRNRVFDVGDGHAGIGVGNDDGAGGPATLEDNVVAGSGWSGIDVTGTGVRVAGNRVTECAAYGFRIRGTGHTVTDCSVKGVGGSGFVVFGTGITLESCEASECEIDAFRIEEGAEATLERCRGTGAAAEGLHVRAGSSTSIRGCVFLDNRQDVASDPPATLEDLGGNTFETGGADSTPVDSAER